MVTKARTKIWLIILVLVSIGSQVEKGRSAEPNVSPGERIIGFPTDVSMGELSVRDWGSRYKEDWTFLGEARGEVTVPAGKELQLKVAPDYSGDFSPLAKLGPSDLQSLVLDNTKVVDEDLAYVKGLTSLRSLSISKKRVVGRSHPLIGKPLGELKFTSLKGEKIDISLYKDKVVLVDFWATWCGPCIGELPNVKNTYGNYHGDGFEIIGISLDSDRSRLEDFIQSNDMPWPQYFDGKGWKNEIAVRFDIHSIPSTFLLDRDGIVRYVNLRGSALKDAVEDLLRGPFRPDGKITSSGMAYLKDLTSLETLRLENTQVGDEGLAYLAGLTSLKTLVLGGTQVTDAGLAHIRNMTKLENLCVHRTKVTDAGLAHIKGLAYLRYLCVYSTLIGDTGLSYLKGLTTLNTLYLRNTQVSDAGLEHLKGLSSLRYLELRGTNVTFAGIKELEQALSNCRISGPSQGRKAFKYRLTRYIERLKETGVPLYLAVLIIAIATPIVCLLTAVFLRYIARQVVKFKVPYWNAYKISLIAAVISIVSGIPFNILGTLWAELLELVVYFLVHSTIFGTMIKHPETNESIGFGRGLLISLFLLLIWFVLACVIGFSIRLLILAIPYI
jgi:thiol-disulfide isomerase/thioredoxin